MISLQNEKVCLDDVLIKRRDSDSNTTLAEKYRTHTHAHTTNRTRVSATPVVLVYE